MLSRLELRQIVLSKPSATLWAIVLALCPPDLTSTAAAAEADGTPVLTVPAADRPLAVGVDLPVGVAFGPKGGLLLKETPTGVEVPAQLVPGATREGLARVRGRLVAKVPAGKGASDVRRFGVVSPSVPMAPAGPGYSIEEVGEASIRVLEADRPVLSYNFGLMTGEHVPERDHRRTRACYVHPVWGLDGEVLTEDFPKDHYHHHGVFWTWPYVGVGEKTYDLWAGDNIHDRFVRWLAREAGPVAAVLGVENGWFVGEKKVMIERVWITAYAADEDSRAIDLCLVLVPTDRPVSLQGRGGKSYGGLTMRFQNLPRRDVTITVPSGRTEGDLKMTELAWVDYTGKYPGREKPSGATVMIHPEHPDYPPTWLTRHYGPLCVGWPGVEARTFQPGEPIRLDYRIRVHRGLPEVDQLSAAYSAYVAAAKAKFE